ncbi:hypothetical protein C2G38_2040008 [Gigaspora rosea]|uniref:Uncharacterized protein n=1 Tax=Gigaspora rosea TaxID=44941 RepID=A0A397V3X9_9GLOM|nr:hypothetical protein C2G38_2040008 [Gigaspora rosea]
MANPKLAPSSDLVNQLAQLLQQLQAALTSSQAESHQRSWKEPCYHSIVHPQHLKQQYPQINQRHNEYHRSLKKEYIRKLFLRSDVPSVKERATPSSNAQM